MRRRTMRAPGPTVHQTIRSPTKTRRRLGVTRSDSPRAPRSARKEICSFSLTWKRTHNQLFWALVTGLLLRLAFVPHAGYQSDVDAFTRWANTLLSNPLSQTYRVSPDIDHLPGDLWLHWLTAHVYRWFSPDFDGDVLPYAEMLKIPPIIGDLTMMMGIFFLVRQRAGSRAGTRAAWFVALNPAIIFISALWGQWDSISASVAIWSLILLGSGRWQWSFPVMTYAILIKPQLAILGVILVVTVALDVLLPLVSDRLPILRQLLTARSRRPRPDPAATASRLGIAVVSSLIVFTAVCLPFQVGFPTLIGTFDIRERLATALDAYTAATMGAFNFWRTPLTLDLVQEQGDYFSDTNAFLFGWTLRTWGMLLSVIGVGTTLILLVLGWRRAGSRLVLWAAAVATLALFIFPTRIHERYFFPSLLFSIALAFIVPRLFPFTVALTITSTLNLVQAFDRNYDILGVSAHYGIFFDPWFAPLVSTLNVLLFGYLLSIGYRLTLTTAATDRRASLIRRLQQRAAGR